MFPWFRRVIGDKTVDAERKALLKEMNEVLLSSDVTKRVGESAEAFAVRQKQHVTSGKSLKLDPKYEFEITRKLNPQGKKIYENYQLLLKYNSRRNRIFN